METIMRVYPLEKAGEFMCVPACLNMIFKRRQLAALPQEVLASELGLTIPKRLQHLHPHAAISDDAKLWGVHPQNPTTSLARLFSNNLIPLAETFYLSSQIPSSYGYTEFIDTQLELGNDIIVGYDYASVFLIGAHVGHVSLVCQANQQAVWLLDPESTDEGSKPVPMSSLLAGIKAVNDGFWIIGTADSIEQCKRIF
jgi:hypothetical protein